MFLYIQLLESRLAHRRRAQLSKIRKSSGFSNSVAFSVYYIIDDDLPEKELKSRRQSQLRNMHALQSIILNN